MISFIFQLSSQHPYAEKFVGEPLVYTIDIWNKREVIATIETILNKTVRNSHRSKNTVSVEPIF